MTLLYTLTGGDKKKEGEKKVFFFKVYKKVNVIKTIWVLVFSICIWYLAYPTDRSNITFYSLNDWAFKVIQAVSVVIWKESKLISPVCLSVHFSAKTFLVLYFSLSFSKFDIENKNP